MFHSLYQRQASAVPTLTPTADPATTGLPTTYLDGFAEFDRETWRLEVDGLVTRTHGFTLQNLSHLPQVKQDRRLVSAEGWSFRVQWEGVLLSDVLTRVVPLGNAKYLIQTDLSGRQECLPVQELVNQRALLCHSINGIPLTPAYGAPYRLLVFTRYAHKGLQQLSRLTLAEEPIPGYWAGKGYDPEAEILPGESYAFDLKAMQSIRNPGEVTSF